MKERSHTIPVNEAFQSGDECPFCYLEREAEHRSIKFTLGGSASYMEPTIRSATNRDGFCRTHLKKMYDFGNYLGSALIMQSYLDILFDEMCQEMDNFQAPGKRTFFSKKTDREDCNLIQWAQQKQSTCFICSKIEYNMNIYYHTFFTLIKDAEFRSRVENTKGFCMHHFLRLMEEAKDRLPANLQEWFYPTVFRLMRENMTRVKGDLDWFIHKSDYRNASADWKNSRDAVSRTMQKLQGGSPADPPFKGEKK